MVNFNSGRLRYMQSPSLLGLIPPALVIVLSLVTKRVITSLLCGSIVAAFIATGYSPFSALLLLAQRALTTTGLPDALHGNDYTTVAFFTFLMLIGIFITTLSAGGGIAAASALLLKRIRTKKGAEITALVSTLPLFIDDYLSNITVGSLTARLADARGLSRLKLAYLLDATISPLCVIVPASSWAAFIVSQLSAHQPLIASLSSQTPYALYLQAVGWLFYPLLSIATAWLITLGGYRFGLLGRIEENQQLIAPHHPATVQEATVRELFISFLIPLTTFFSALFISLICLGRPRNLTFSELLAALNRGTSTIFYGLCCAAFIGCLVALSLFIWRRRPSLQKIMQLLKEGSLLMKGSMLLLLCAWTFGSFIKTDLHVGELIAYALCCVVKPWLLPFMAFACSLLFSLSTGSVWGAIAVLMPIAWSTLAALCCAQEAELLAPTLAALISGGIAGSHLCMAGDATILSASSAGADHPLHTMTMSAYALPVIIIAALQTLAAGFVTSTKMLLLIHASGITLLIATLQILHTLYHRR